MRRVLHGDVVAAARALLAVPRALRRALAVRLLREADLADRHWQSKGHAHPLWGDGCLETVASRRRLVAEPYLDEPEYIEALMLVFEALLNFRRARS